MQKRANIHSNNGKNTLHLLTKSHKIERCPTFPPFESPFKPNSLAVTRVLSTVHPKKETRKKIGQTVPDDDRRRAKNATSARKRRRAASPPFGSSPAGPPPPNSRVTYSFRPIRRPKPGGGIQGPGRRGAEDEETSSWRS